MFLKRLSPRTLFSLTPSSLLSPYSIFIARCSSSSPSHLTYPHSHNHPDSRNVGVSAWWDLENCNVPPGVNVFRGAQAITAAIESSGIKGPIDITAFGDKSRLARTDQEALSSSAINFNHIPHDGNYSAHSALFKGLTCWVPRNPPPAHLFLIIGDKDSSSILHQLRLNNYNILVATKEPFHYSITSAATIMWNWDALVRGENLSGRYFNRPPKCPSYDHYDGPLEVPFIEIDPEELLPDVFSQDSFWTDLQTFIHTDIGSLLIAESSSREKLAYYLWNYGPSVIKSVKKRDVLRMVDMLIEDKAWVREDPNDDIRPFHLSSSYSISRFADSYDDFLNSE